LTTENKFKNRLKPKSQNNRTTVVSEFDCSCSYNMLQCVCC